MAHFNDLRTRQYDAPTDLVWRGRFVHNWFSNFDAVGAPVTYRGRTTRRLELAFVAAKNPGQVVKLADGREAPFIDLVFAQTTPGGAKQLGAPKHRGGVVDLRPDWDEVSVAAMDFFLRQRWQPGAEGASRLAALPSPIVEWNNWRDDRWGAVLGSHRGRNALGLLLDVIAGEIRAGRVAPGADEAHWRERQEELVAALNAYEPTPAARHEPPQQRQMTLF